MLYEYKGMVYLSVISMVSKSFLIKSTMLELVAFESKSLYKTSKARSFRDGKVASSILSQIGELLNTRFKKQTCVITNNLIQNLLLKNKYSTANLCEKVLHTKKIFYHYYNPKLKYLIFCRVLSN